MEKPGKARVDVHFGEIRSELSQVDKVMEDAVATLFGAFTNISDLVRLQQRISAQFGWIHQSGDRGAPGQHPPGWIADDSDPALARRDSSVALLFAQQAAVGEQLESQVNAVVQSLQFQDIAAQLLARALNRLELLETLVGGPGATARARKRRHAAAVSSDAKSVQKDDLADVIVFPRTQAAGYYGMKAGDVDLF